MLEEVEWLHSPTRYEGQMVGPTLGAVEASAWAGRVSFRR